MGRYLSWLTSGQDDCEFIPVFLLASFTGPDCKLVFPPRITDSQFARGQAHEERILPSTTLYALLPLEFTNFVPFRSSLFQEHEPAICIAKFRSPNSACTALRFLTFPPNANLRHVVRIPTENFCFIFFFFF